jgi:rRNA maturation protein Nop10
METCPHCGELLETNARACPACGSDEQTGWSARARFDSLGVPDDEFSHEEFVRREFGGMEKIPRGIHWLWWLVAVGLVVGFLVSLRGK